MIVPRKPFHWRGGGIQLTNFCRDHIQAIFCNRIDQEISLNSPAMWGSYFSSFWVRDESASIRQGASGKDELLEGGGDLSVSKGRHGDVLLSMTEIYLNIHMTDYEVGIGERNKIFCHKI